MNSISFDPCSSCIGICKGSKLCPVANKEDYENLSRPIPVERASSLAIPDDVYPILLKANITTPKNGTILLEWDAQHKQVRILIHDNDLPRRANKFEFYVSGKDTFKRVKLHWKKGVLIKVTR